MLEAQSKKLTQQSIKIHFPVVITLLHWLYLATGRGPSRGLRLYYRLSCRATLTSDCAGMEDKNGDIHMTELHTRDLQQCHMVEEEKSDRATCCTRRTAASRQSLPAVIPPRCTASTLRAGRSREAIICRRLGRSINSLMPGSLLLRSWQVEACRGARSSLLLCCFCRPLGSFQESRRSLSLQVMGR